MNRFHLLRLALIIEVLVLVINTAAISRDYQDSWILEGLEIPFAVLVATYIIYVFIETKIEWVIPFVVVFSVVFGLLPNLKYAWFQGVWPDQHGAYRLAQDIHYQNHIPADRLYSDTPLMHLLFAIFSKETGIPILSSFKYCPVLMWSIYPLIMYMILKSCGIAQNSSILKYALIVSSVPATTPATFLVTGSLIGVLMVLLILSQFMRLMKTRDRRDSAVLIVFAFALVSAHSYSATMLTIVLFTVYVMMQLAYRFFPRKFSPLQPRHLFPTLTLIGLLNLGWLVHKATSMFDLMTGFMYGYVNRAFGAEVSLDQPVPPSFFELIRTDFMEGLKVVLAWYGATLLVALLMLIGLLLVAREIRGQSKQHSFLIVYVVSLSLFLTSGLALGISSGWSERILRFLAVTSPIFCGVSLVYVNKKMHRSAAFVVLVLIVLATVQSYGCQPLVPSASVLNKGLPEDVPIGYRVEVNSIYQRCMIQHAERYIPQNASLRIACDRVTHYQIMGLTSWGFSTLHLAWYYPLDKDAPERNYYYFLVHLPGKSGRFYERAEIRTPSLILQVIYNSSVLYSNHESYLLTER